MPITNRLFTPIITSCLLLAWGGTAQAQIDFNRLLAQLPSTNQDVDEAEPIKPPSGEASDVGELLAPVLDAPEQPTNRTLAEPSVRTTEPVDPAQPEIKAWPNQVPSPPSVLENQLVPEAPQASVDFQQLFDQQDRQPTDVVMAYEPAVAAHVAWSGCDSSAQNCQPHRRPNLPPPATMESMYHAPACHRDVWAGYAAERQAACDRHHKHLHHQCDCLQPSCTNCGPALYPDAACANLPGKTAR